MGNSICKRCITDKKPEDPLLLIQPHTELQLFVHLTQIANEIQEDREFNIPQEDVCSYQPSLTAMVLDINGPQEFTQNSRYGSIRSISDISGLACEDPGEAAIHQGPVTQSSHDQDPSDKWLILTASKLKVYSNRFAILFDEEPVLSAPLTEIHSIETHEDSDSYRFDVLYEEAEHSVSSETRRHHLIAKAMPSLQTNSNSFVFSFAGSTLRNQVWSFTVKSKGEQQKWVQSLSDSGCVIIN